LSKTIVIVVLICFLVLGAAVTAIVGRDSIPSARTEMALRPEPGAMVANRTAKADRFSISAPASASTAVEPAPSSAVAEPLREAFASAMPSDFPVSKTSASKRPVVGSETSPRPAKPKVVARPQPQKIYSFLSDAQIAGIKARLKLSSSQEHYWPSVEIALRKVARKIQANRLSNPQVHGVPIDPDCDEVQQLKSAAMPLLFQLRDDQKEEVRNIARIIGLYKVAQQI